MVLQIDWAGLGTRLVGCRGSRTLAGKFYVIMHQDAVVQDRHARVGDELVSLVLRRSVFDVIGLPGKRRQSHVHVRRLHRVQPAAFVVFPLQAERVEHLTFIASPHVNPAIAAPLAAIFRLIRSTELDVHLATAELLLTGATLH